MADERFDPDLLDDEDPFEIDAQAAHLFKHPDLGIDDIKDMWASDPLWYPAKPPAHWLMCAEVAGQVLVVPLAPSSDGDPAGAVRSGATRPPSILLTATGKTDDPMTNDTPSTMTPDEEHAFYARPENQEPQGPPRRRKSKLSAMVPVRLPPELLDEIRQRADADDRSVSSWIRRAIERELDHTA